MGGKKQERTGAENNLQKGGRGGKYESIYSDALLAPCLPRSGFGRHT